MRLIGVPVVFSSNIPESISTLSDSLRVVVILLCPGFRRSNSFWISVFLIVKPAGHPSIATPMAGPWDSPHVVIFKRVPKLFPDMSKTL